MANEKRLIDANATLAGIEAFMQCYAEKEKELTPFWIKVAIQALDMVRQFIKGMPTVDAVEVVHGEWGEIYTCHGERLWGYKCSQCEQDNPNKSNYCPNCGAKMDGGNEDEL